MTLLICQFWVLISLFGSKCVLEQRNSQRRFIHFPIVFRRWYAGGQECVQPYQKQWVIHSLGSRRLRWMRWDSLLSLIHWRQCGTTRESSQCSEAAFKPQQSRNCWCSRLDPWSLLELWSGGGALTVDLKVFYLCLYVRPSGATLLLVPPPPPLESQNNHNDSVEYITFEHCSGLLMYSQLYRHNLASLVEWCQ